MPTQDGACTRVVRQARVVPASCTDLVRQARVVPVWSDKFGKWGDKNILGKNLAFLLAEAHNAAVGRQ